MMQLLGWWLPSCLPLWLKSSEAEMHVWARWCSIEVLWTGLCRCSIPIKRTESVATSVCSCAAPLDLAEDGLKDAAS